MSAHAARLAVDEVLAAHAAFYAAFERADFDAMQAVWAEDDGRRVRPPGRRADPRPARR